MDIESICLHRVRVPYETARRRELQTHDPYNMATARAEGMECLMIEITTSDGLTGWGEAFGHKANPATWAALSDVVGPYFLTLAGADPVTLQQQASRTFHAFGQSGPFVYALSGIDIALWDIAAQRADLPLHQLLGSQRTAIPAYPSLPAYVDPDEVAYQVRRVQALGYQQIKLHETSLPAMDAALDALQTGVELMVDVNCPWDALAAEQAARHLKARGMGWLEEPLWPPDDIDGLARLRTTTGMRIAAGENASGVNGLLQLMQGRAIDIAQPSIAKIGGITGMQAVLKLAAAMQIQVVPHCFYFGPGLLATAHVVATLPQGTPLEVPFLAFQAPLHNWMAFEPVMQLPTAPGLGFMPDPHVMETHTLARQQLNRP